MKNVVRTVRQSFSFYPVTAVYLVGVFVACGIAANQIELTTGLFILTSLTLIIVLVALAREVRTVHHLVNSQREDLVQRISDLVNTLQEAGVTLPAQRETVGDSPPLRKGKNDKSAGSNPQEVPT